MTASPPTMPAAEVEALYAAAHDRTGRLVEDLAALVRMESPSGDIARLDAIAEAIALRWEARGARVVAHRDPRTGTHLEIRWPGPPGTPAGAPPALVVGHLDTVHAVGALERNPLRQVDGLLHGPGAQDMKGGLVVAEHAVSVLADRGRALPRPVVVLITADEETGSLTSRELIEDHARNSAHAFVLEGAAPGGAIKTARKGVGLFEIIVSGTSAHAGAHFDEGVNAAVGLAEVIPVMAALSDLERGTTVNVGVVRAGTVVNVVPDRAVAQIDLRFVTDDEAQRVAEALHGLEPARGRLQVRGGVNRPAMRRTPAIADLFERARATVACVEDLTETSVGGASDGNFTAAVGTPTLDGLGPAGAGLHTDREYVRVDSLAGRTGLLATLLGST